MSYSATEIEQTIDTLFAHSFSMEDAEFYHAANAMRRAADILQSVLDAREWKFQLEGLGDGDE